jgi:hypothetical protein
LKFSKKGGVAALSAGVAAALLMGTAAAQAAPTFAVHAGKAKPGTQVIFSAKANSVTFSDKNSGFTVNCTGVTTPGSTRTGKRAGAGIARLAGGKAHFKNCSAFSGLLTGTVKGVGHWRVNARSVKKGVVAGSVSRIHLNVSTSLGCSYTLKGRAPAHYLDGKHTLQLLGGKAQLAVSNASQGCQAAVSNGDKVSASGRFVVHAAKKRFNPITIRR